MEGGEGEVEESVEKERVGEGWEDGENGREGGEGGE